MTETGADRDEDLAGLAKHGDRAAFETLVRRHKDDLYRFVRRHVGQADDAYDVLQNALVAAWLGLHRYDPARPFAPWLRTITLNKCRDYGRRQTVRRLLLFAIAAEPEETTQNPSVLEDQSAEGESLDRLDSAIATLPALYKDPLLLTSVSGLSHQEAAEILKTTPKAVEMRIYRAKRRLAQILGQ